MYRNERGLTLIEIMLAMAVFGIVMVTFMSAVRGYYRVNEVNLDQVRMMELARAETEKIKAEVSYALPSDSQGNIYNKSIYYPPGTEETTYEQKYAVLYEKTPTTDPNGWILKVTVGPYDTGNPDDPLNVDNSNNFVLESWLPTAEEGGEDLVSTPIEELELTAGTPSGTAVNLDAKAIDSRQNEYDITLDEYTEYTLNPPDTAAPFFTFSEDEAVLEFSDAGVVDVTVSYFSVTPQAIKIEAKYTESGSPPEQPTEDDVESYLVAVNEFSVNQGGNIDGKVYVTSPAIINQSVIITDDAYYCAGLSINQDTTYNKDLYVYGDTLFNQNITINGDLYVNGNLSINQTSYARDLYLKNGVITLNQGLTVRDLYVPEGTEIPSNLIYENVYYVSFTMPTLEVSIPILREDSWYEDNGFEIVYTSYQDVTLVSGGKYYFLVDYNFNQRIENLHNVTIVAKGNLNFNQRFGNSSNKNSGIIFVPDGRLSFNQRCYFKGLLIGNDLDCNQTIDFEYYLDPNLTLPYDTVEELTVIVMEEE